VIIARYQNAVYAFSLALSASSTPASMAGKTITSSNVRSTIRIFTATASTSTARGRARVGWIVFAVRRDNGNIAVDLDKLFSARRGRRGVEAAALQL